ncbi:CAP domain-containing protein [Metabacillus herbersteinensis]|uniref:CAP domain-containing protein n=1 Tax=Metabacillus herbersteinensis TaxID=283816 RepID=A0ABV6GJL7_9BACI
MIRKKVTVFVTSIFFVMLVACNNNDNALDTANRDNPNRSGGEGIQQVGTGHLTIDQNSFSTTIPSEKFPHSKQIQQGEFKFYKANPNERHRQEGAPQPDATAPQQPAPQPQQENAEPNQPQEQPKQEAPANPPEQEQQQPQADQAAEGITAAETKVIELTNAERRKNGLPDLKADNPLSNVAGKKSDDMKENNYFSHTSPTYGSPFDMMRDFGVDYKTAGENIAQGQQSPEQVVQAWMKSEGHRKNILSGDFTHIGVGHTQDGNYWTQMFIGK